MIIRRKNNFNLVLFKGIVGKQLTKGIDFKKGLRVHFQGALKQKTKTCRFITEVFHFYAECFILPFLLRTVFKTVAELLHLSTVHPKLIFWGALKTALMISEVRSYQTQYFAKIFSSPLALTLHIHFYLHLKESS